MIKKLRIKFILVSMLSVFLVLFFTIGTINLTNYIALENDAKTSLQVAVNQGMEELSPGGPNPNERRGVDTREMHYFVVTFSTSGEIQSINNRQMFMISEDECKDLATKVFNGTLTGGKYDSYRYLKTSKEDGLTYVCFVDIREKIDNHNRFLLTSSLYSLAAFGVLFLLIFISSKIVFKPSEEAYKNQKRFITNASHELKTPLTIISADLDLIEMDNGKSEWSTSIKDQVKRLNDMTNQLVTLSKIDEEDKNRFPFNDFSLNEVCNKAVESFAPSFKKSKIKFASNISNNITMYGNKNLIEELIYIFLDNSLKYTSGENKSSYFVVSENEKGKIEMRFSNTIDKNDKVNTKQIFDRFYRSPTTNKPGSGIGLSIVKEIINLHKGKIKIENNNFTLTFIINF